MAYIPQDQFKTTLQKLREEYEQEIFYILCVDDGIADRDVLRSILESDQFKMHHNQDLFIISSITKASKIYNNLYEQSAAPNMVMISNTAGGGEGFELANEIFKMDHGAFTVMTGYSPTEADILKATMVGAQGFLKKPYSGDAIYNYINKYFLKQLKSDITLF
jgi:DNA-binding NtrC family response regulator